MPSLFLDLARAMERACFDYILIEDSIYVGQNWKNSREIFLKNGMSVPRQEPSVVATMMAAVTSRLGIVPTLRPSPIILIWRRAFSARSTRCRRDAPAGTW